MVPFADERCCANVTYEFAVDGADYTDKFSFFDRFYVYAFSPIANRLVYDKTFDSGEKRIIAADAHVFARLNARASLANEDVAR